MITLTGTYADDCNGPLPDVTLKYAGRLFAYGSGRHIKYFTPIDQEVKLKDGDVLKVCGAGTWFAHYTLEGADPPPEEIYPLKNRHS